MRGRTSTVGETKVSPNGYHYTRTESGWQLTGRLIAEQKIGRKLKSNERVRYLDGNKMNLVSENIEVRTVAAATPYKRLAQLEAKRDEINAQIEELMDEIKELENS